MNLPKELQEVILGYIDPKDKVYVSRTCTLFKRILETQFNQKYKDANHIPTNCSYDLYLYLSKFTIPNDVYFKFRTYILPYSNDDVRKIDCTDNNNLNVLVHFLNHDNNINLYKVNILKEYYVNNYTIKPKYVTCLLSKITTEYKSEFVRDIRTGDYIHNTLWLAMYVHSLLTPQFYEYIYNLPDFIYKKEMLDFLQKHA